MKHTTLGSAILWMVLLGALPPQSQSQPLEYLRQALLRVTLFSTYGNIAGYEFADGICLLGTYLASGEARSFRCTFEGSQNYIIVGATDEDVLDLDLSLYSSDGRIIETATDEDELPVLRYRAQFTGERSIRLTNFRSRADGFCVMVILRETSLQRVTFLQVAQALDNLIGQARYWSAPSSFATDAWCVFGGRVDSQEDEAMINVSLRQGRYRYIGAASNNVQDADVFVLRQYLSGVSSGEEVCRDIDTDVVPFCTFSAFTGQSFVLRYRNYQSYGPGFVFTVLMKQ